MLLLSLLFHRCSLFFLWTLRIILIPILLFFFVFPFVQQIVRGGKDFVRGLLSHVIQGIQIIEPVFEDGSRRCR